MTSGGEEERRFVLRDDDSVPAVIDAFRDFAGFHQLPIKLINDFCIILDELVSNIVRHGYRGRAGANVEVTLSAREGLLQVELIDDAPPFNMLERPDPETHHAVSERTIGGLGIFLVKRLSDEVRYDYHTGRNRLVIRKRI